MVLRHGGVGVTDYKLKRRFIAKRNPVLVGYRSGRWMGIRGVMIHTTRGGRTEGDDGPGTEGWMSHPENKGAAWDGLIYESGQQVKCMHWELDEEPKWAAGYGDYPGTWSAQDFYLHFEIGQGTVNDPISKESFESAAQWVAEVFVDAGYDADEVTIISYLRQTAGTEPPVGICFHDQSANGRKLGKSDPGHMFDRLAFGARVRDHMLAKGVEPVADLTARRLTAIEYYLVRKTGQEAIDHMNEETRLTSKSLEMRLENLEDEGGPVWETQRQLVADVKALKGQKPPTEQGPPVEFFEITVAGKKMVVPYYGTRG